MIGGAFAGVMLSCLSVIGLVAMGEPVHPWSLSLDGWWVGGAWPLRLAAGGGVLLLAVTPVLMLFVFGIQALRQRRRRAVIAVAGLTAVLALGLWLALSGCV
jgi:hypothetical protein